MVAVVAGTFCGRRSGSRATAARSRGAQATGFAPSSGTIRLMNRLIAALCLGVLPQAATAAEPCVLPPNIELTGPFGTQRLLVVDADGGTVVGDRTAEAT